MYLCVWVDGWSIYVHKKSHLWNILLQLWIAYKSIVSVIGIEIVKLRYSSDSQYHTSCLLPTSSREPSSCKMAMVIWSLEYQFHEKEYYKMEALKI